MMMKMMMMMMMMMLLMMIMMMMMMLMMMMMMMLMLMLMLMLMTLNCVLKRAKDLKTISNSFVLLSTGFRNLKCQMFMNIASSREIQWILAKQKFSPRKHFQTPLKRGY